MDLPQAALDIEEDEDLVAIELPDGTWVGLNRDVEVKITIGELVDRARESRTVLVSNTMTDAAFQGLVVLWKVGCQEMVDGEFDDLMSVLAAQCSLRGTTPAIAWEERADV